MNIYLFTLILLITQLLVLMIIPKNRNLKIKNDIYNLYDISSKIFFYIDIGWFIVMMTFRDASVGTDSENYLYYFKVIKNSDFLTALKVGTSFGLEIGFVILNKLIGLFFNNIFYQFVMGCLAYIPMGIYIKRNSKNYVYSLLVFFCLGLVNQSFNITRQYIAISLLLYSMKYVENRDFNKFFLYVLLVSSIHKTALLFLIVYPLYNKKKISNISVIIFVILIVTLLIFGGQIANFVNMFIYSNYYGRRPADVGLSIFINFAILMAIFFFSNRNKERNTTFYIYMSSIVILLNLLGIHIDLFNRIMLYFKIFYIISIPNMIKSINSYRYLFSVSICILLSVFFIYVVFTTSMNGTIPYIFMNNK